MKRRKGIALNACHCMIGEGSLVENPRKHLNRNDSKNRNGQVVNLSEYQNRRRKHDRKRRQPTRRQKSNYVIDNHSYLRWLCYFLVTVAIVFSVLGMVALSWRTTFQMAGVLAATVGLGCGLWLNVLKDRLAIRILLGQTVTFAIAYLCGILHFVI